MVVGLTLLRLVRSVLFVRSVVAQVNWFVRAVVAVAGVACPIDHFASG